MSSASKVGDIFTAAGAAFSKLGELTMTLHPTGEPAPASGGKWTEQEIDMLRQAVQRFGDDLNQISGVIKNRTISQIKAQIKKRGYEEAGLSPPAGEEKTSPKKNTPGGGAVVKAQSPGRGEPSTKKQKTAEVTLSALNAPDTDVDIESMVDNQAIKAKLDFDSDVDSSIL